MNKIDRVICTVLMIVMFGSTILQVFCRFVLNSPLPWTDEVARDSFIWIIFWGAGIGVRRKGHLVMDVVVNLFPPKLRRAAGYFTQIASMAFLALVLSQSLRVIWMTRKIQTSGLRISVGWVYLIIPISAAIMLYEIAKPIYRDYKGLGERSDA